jgi:hypothetical protein
VPVCWTNAESRALFQLKLAALGFGGRAERLEQDAKKWELVFRMNPALTF